MSAFSEANRKAFDELSATYNTQPWQLKLTSQISDALQERKDWIGVEWATPDDRTSEREVRLLDYACGTGAITTALGPWVTVIRGIDISEKMVKVYNEAARSSGLTVEQANAVTGDLFATPVPTELNDAEFQNFDIAVIGLGFHHFEDPELAVKRLTERLKPETGTLVIIDFLPFDHKVSESDLPSEMAGMAHTIKHNGFVRDGIERLFTAAGLQDFDFQVLDTPAKMELKTGPVERGIFIAKGRKAPTAWRKLVNWLGSAQDGIGSQMGLQADPSQWSAGLPTKAGHNPPATNDVGRLGPQRDQQKWTGGV